MVVSMRRMAVNQEGRVAAITVGGEMGRRLRDMGLVPGARVMVVGRAPLTDPVAVRLRGFTLSLRNGEAEHVAVEAC